MKHFLFIAALLFTAIYLPAERLVFDMPEVHTRHMELLKLMNSAYKRGDFHAMGTVCEQGIKLHSADSLWTYNLACSLSLQKKPDEALKALKNAITLGFHDLEFIKSDKDLANLHKLEDFNKVLDELEQTLISGSFTNSTARQITALAPQADNTVLQAETNTVWSFNTALFHTFISMQPEKSTNTATLKTDDNKTSPFLLYVNRDNKSNDIDFPEIPNILKLNYCKEMRERQQHIGAPNTLFIDSSTGELIPVVGNSSMGFINSAYWRCQPRAFFNNPDQIKNQLILFLGNQLYFYPTYSDYRIETGDLFPANTPFYVAVSGSTKSEQPFVKAIADAICALTPQTRRYLTSSALLMPTMQQLLRKSQKAVKTKEDYMSGIAHPAAFQPGQLDRQKLIENARKLTTNNIPPIVLIKVEDSSGLNQALDMPTCVYTENLFDIPFASARVFRAFPYRRKYKVTTLCREHNAKIHCVLLQGDPEKVAIGRNPDDPNDWMLNIAYHPPFTTRVAGGKRITTTRVDIGFFAETENSISIPSILSISFLGNELRKYDDKEHLLSIDYRRNTTLYTDPLLSYPRNWKDEFSHDKDGRITGWTRIRPRKKERFTAYGDLAIEFDDKGRATKARRIKYTKRYIGDLGRESGRLPSLAQVDDNIEVNYTYASDDDYIGKPDTTITRKLSPPIEKAD